MLKEKIQIHMRECYSLSDAVALMVEKGEQSAISSKVKTYFTKEPEQVEFNLVAFHQ